MADFWGVEILGNILDEDQWNLTNEDAYGGNPFHISIAEFRAQEDPGAAVFFPRNSSDGPIVLSDLTSRKRSGTMTLWSLSSYYDFWLRQFLTTKKKIKFERPAGAFSQWDFSWFGTEFWFQITSPVEREFFVVGGPTQGINPGWKVTFSWQEVIADA